MKSGMLRTQEQDDLVINKFQETMKSFVKLNDDVTQVFTFLKDVAMDVSLLRGEHESLKNSSQNQSQATSDMLKSVKDNVLSFSEAFDKTGNALSEIKKILEHFQNEISGMKGQISQISDKNKGFAGIEDIKVINNDLKSMSQNMMSLFQSANEKYIDTANSINSLKSFSTSVHKDILDQKDYTKKIVQSLDNLISEHNILKLTSNTSFHDMKSVIMKYVDEKIDAIPKPVIPSLDDAKKTYEEKLTPALFDAKNANLRSSNNESKIYILEKKVEQLQLLLNKMQLQG